MTETPNRRALTRTRRLAYYALGSLLTVSVLFAVVELVTRTLSWARGAGFTLALHELDPYDAGVTQLYEWHPFTGFTFRPGMTFEGMDPSRREVARVFVDQHGFLAKDPGLSLAKPEGEVRIAAIGGSTTANIGLSYERNWPGRLGVLVAQALPDRKVRVINAGVPGFDTAQSIPNLALRVMPFQPDVVVIYHAYNDLKAIHRGAPFKPDYSHIHRKPYGEHERPSLIIRTLNQSMAYVRVRNRYRELANVTALRDSFEEGGRLAEVPVEAEQAFAQHIRTLVGIARAGGASVVLSSFATLHDPGEDYTRPQTFAKLTALQRAELGHLLRFTPGLTLQGVFGGIKRYNAILRHTAQEMGTGWVDSAARIPHSDEYFVDRVHFARAGAERMARELLPVVLAALQARRTATSGKPGA